LEGDSFKDKTFEDLVNQFNKNNERMKKLEPKIPEYMLLLMKTMS